jgi:hypothetical protein
MEIQLHEDLEAALSAALRFALRIEAYDVAGHLAHALHAHTTAQNAQHAHRPYGGPGPLCGHGYIADGQACPQGCPEPPTERLVRVPMVGRTRDEAPRTAHPLCICPRNGAGRIGTDPGCPIHQPGAAGLHAVPTERIEPPAEWHRHAIEVDAGQPYRKWEPGPVHPGPEEACRLHPAQQAVSEQPEA